MAEPLQRLLDQRRQRLQVEKIGLDQRDGIGARAVEFRLQEPRRPGGGAVVEHEIRARSMQAAADRGADTLGAARDQGPPCPARGAPAG